MCACVLTVRLVCYGLGNFPNFPEVYIFRKSNIPRIPRNYAKLRGLIFFTDVCTNFL